MKHRKKKKGASLIIVLMVLAVAMIFSSVTLTTISKTTKANAQEKKSEDVLFSAESGLEYGIAWFNKNKTTGVISVPPTNGCTYDVKVEPDGSNYKIISKATINGKSKTVSVKVNKIETPPTAGGGLTIGSPFGVIVPTLSNMKLPTTSDKINDIRNALTYEDNKNIYNLNKAYWPTNQTQTKIGLYTNPIEINYNKVNLSLVDINIGNKNININGSKLKVLEQKNVSNNNITIYTVENGNGYNIVNGVMSVDGDLKITSKNKQNIDQDLSKMGINKIIVKGVVSIEADGDVKLNNFNIESNKFINYSKSNLSISNSTITCESEINSFNNATTYFNNINLLSRAIKIDSGSPVEVANSIITSDDLIINSNTTITINGTKIKSKKYSSTSSLNGGNGDTINFTNKSEIISENFKLICNAVNIAGDSGGYTKIITNNFDADCKNDNFIINKGMLMADVFTVVSNNFSANNSGLLIKNINLNVRNITSLNQSSMISENANFYYANQVNINNSGLDKTVFDSIINEMKKYLPGGAGTPGTIEYKIDNTSLKYE